MTNTTAPHTTVPHTLTGVTCGRCSTKGANKIIRKHATTADVAACFAVGYAAAQAPTAKITVPAGPGQFLVKVPGTDIAVPAPAQPVTVNLGAPAPKKFGRYMAACFVKGCKRHETRNAKFLFKCPDHHSRVWAKQLVGQLSTSDKHKCNDACMYAKGPTCTCQCGGANHSVGYLVKV